MENQKANILQALRNKWSKEIIISDFDVTKRQSDIMFNIIEFYKIIFEKFLPKY